MAEPRGFALDTVLPQDYPAPRTIRAAIARFYLRFNGWTVAGRPPDTDHCVIIAAPHTSNWDLIYMLGYAWLYGLDVSWMGKDSLFWFPLGPLLRHLGGLAIDRKAKGNVVGQMVDAFKNRDRLLLAVPPAGTRSHRPYWKSGFYYIAHGAGVPIATGFLDYKRKIGGFGPLVHTTGDIEADMATLKAFYDTIEGRFPEMVSTIAIKPADTRSK